MTNILTKLSEFVENIFPTSTEATPVVQVIEPEPPKKVYGEFSRTLLPDPKGVDLELRSSSYIKETIFSINRARTDQKVKINKFLNSDEAPWLFPKWLRSYYQYYISGWFDQLFINYTLFEVLISYIVVIYVVLLVVLFLKKLIFP